MLARCQGNKREASQVLGISYHTLQSYLRHPLHAVAPPEASTDVTETAMAVGAGV